MWTAAVAAGPVATAAEEATSGAPAKGADSARKSEPRFRATWQLGPLQVISPGSAKQLKEGRITEGYTVRADAKAIGGAPFPDGTLTFTLSSFTPAADMPKQPKGFWYVKGSWRLVRTGSSVPSTARHSPDALQGYLVAQLPLDPVKGKGGWAAAARTPKGAAPAGWTQARGSLNVDEAVGGTFHLEME